MPVGIDICRIDRMSRLLQKDTSRVFCAEEHEYCLSHTQPLPHYAGIWAVKESVIKAVGNDITMRDITVTHLPSGQPHLILDGKYASFDTDISISHDGEYAVGICIVTNK